MVKFEYTSKEIRLCVCGSKPIEVSCDFWSDSICAN